MCCRFFTGDAEDDEELRAIIDALQRRDLEGAMQATEDNWMLNFHLVIEPALRKLEADRL